MVDWRENLNWIVGSITATIGGVLAYLQEYEFLGTLFGTVIGAGIAYFVQGRTQKRTWKREYSVKIVEEVYGALYNSIIGIIRNLEEKYYNGLDFSIWRGFQVQHRYFMVDEEFRNRLDSFSESVEKYTKACLQLQQRILPNILKQAIKEVFNVEVEGKPNLEVNYVKNQKNFSTKTLTLDKLTKSYSLSEIVDETLKYEDKSIISNISVNINAKKPYSSGWFNCSESKKVEIFWGTCLKKMKSHETYVFIVEENERLLKETQKIKKELIKRIEEPWKI